jgi:hypothetical protein
MAERIYQQTDSLHNPLPINLYEERLDKKYGIKLGKIQNGEKTGLLEVIQKDVLFIKNFNYFGHVPPSQKLDEILSPYVGLSEFCSMKIKSEKELIGHVKFVHELSYCHYILGKEEDIKGSFPEYCCGHSASNILFTLMKKGYPNATYFYNRDRDHAYNGLPFVFGEQKDKGFIIIDPTSDQLFYDKNHTLRNNVFVVFGTKWEYKTDFASGADLFPRSEDNSAYINLNTVIKYHYDLPMMLQDLDIERYFDKVFDNVVDIEVGSLG